MTDELKPVPCGCGGEASVITCAFGNAKMVLCGRCGMRTVQTTEVKAIEAWNRAMSGNVQECAKDARYNERTAKVKGRWQRREGSDCWECSECHAVLENNDLGMHNFYFCYHCGANMMNRSGYMDIEEVHYE